jgi:tetratricopeptide (TPR) repeat protein
MKQLLLAGAFAVVTMLNGVCARAAQDDPRLDALFDKLKMASSETEATAAEVQIWRIWAEHKNPEIARLMRDGIAALGEDEQELALDDFNAVVKHDRSFAEGWNKRATVEFVMGNFNASIADVERTLALEPRHFGALSGLGQIYLALDRKELALKAFRAALAINPYLPGVRQKIEELEKAVKGSPI